MATLTLASTALLTANLGGCDNDAQNQDFRAASAQQLETGVQYIASGLITGAFDLWFPEDNPASTSTNGALAGSGPITDGSTTTP